MYSTKHAETPKRAAASTSGPQQHPPPQVAGRLASLDAFRGLTVAGMLLVNNVALDYRTPQQLTHAPWNKGVHFADMVFPWFLFIVGVAIPYSAASHRRKGGSAFGYHLKALKRAALLILLGCFVDSSVARQPVVGLGVLQLIGLAYLVGALLYSLPLPWRLASAGMLLVSHWAAIRLVPVPGLGAGVFNEHANIIDYINTSYLGRYHLAGLVSVVPTAALVLIGTATGDALRGSRPASWRCGLWVLSAGVAMASVGWLWSRDLPFNKPVWTASYILYTGGWGAVLLALMYLVVDVKGRRAWAFPLVVFGMNAIAGYVLPIVVKTFILQGWSWRTPNGTTQPLQQAILGSLKGWAGQVAGGWLYTFGYIAVWWLVLLLMYRKQVFLRV